VTLHPDHVANLRGSGLTDETIAASGIWSVPPTDFPRVLGPRLAGLITSAMAIPYPNAGGFARFKLFPPVATANGGTMRYYQPAGSAPRLYFSQRAWAARTDPSVPLVVTEGEKKTLAADQVGLACFGVGGLWSWLQDGAPIPDLDQVDYVGRPVWLVPDSDVWTRPELLQPVYALGKELESRGAMVSVVKLSAGEKSEKVGLDEYLCTHSIEAFHQLPKLCLTDAPLARLSTWHKNWVRRKAHDADSLDARTLLERGETVRQLHPAHDVVDGVLWYGVPAGDALVLVNSDRLVCTAAAVPRGLALRHVMLRESSVSRTAALAWSAGETGSVAGALDALAAFIRTYVVFSDARIPVCVAVWGLGTWVYRAFTVYPYLSIRSPEKRCGKTRLLKVLRVVTFNAGPLTALPTEAQLYRGAASTGGVQLFDEMEGLRGDKERYDALISVLNVGFERGGVVTRLEKRGDRFEEQRYEVFTPRALAGIAALKDVLADRALPIYMARKRRDERVARLTAAVERETAQLRDQCALACLSHIHDILFAAEQAPALLEQQGVDDRATDLWVPLVALALVADAEDNGTRTKTLLERARELGGLRDADQDDGQTARLVEVLEVIRETGGDTLAPEALRAALADRPGWAWVTSTRRLAGLLNPLGLVRERLRDGARLRWAYCLHADRLADLRARYGGSGDPT